MTVFNQNVANGISETQSVYVSKIGDDTRSGLNPNLACLTIGAAITAASGLTPAADNIVTVKVLDAGTYTEDVSVPQYVVLAADEATIVGEITVAEDSTTRVKRIEPAAGDAVTKSAGTGRAHVVVHDAIVLTAASNGIVCNAGDIGIDIKQIILEDGTAVGGTSTSNIGGRVDYIEISGSGLALGGTASGCDINVDVVAIEGPVSGIGIVAESGVIVNARIGHINCLTAIDSQAGGEVYVECTRIDGVRVNGGGVLTVCTVQSGVPLYECTLTHASFTAALQSEAVACPNFPEDVYVLGGNCVLGTEFSGGGTTACDAELGDAGDPDGLMTSTDVFTGAGTGVKSNDGVEVGVHTEAAFSPTLTLTVDGAHTVADLDAGSITVQIPYIQQG